MFGPCLAQPAASWEAESGPRPTGGIDMGKNMNARVNVPLMGVGCVVVVAALILVGVVATAGDDGEAVAADSGAEVQDGAASTGGSGGDSAALPSGGSSGGASDPGGAPQMVPPPPPPSPLSTATGTCRGWFPDSCAAAVAATGTCTSGDNSYNSGRRLLGGTPLQLAPRRLQSAGSCGELAGQAFASGQVAVSSSCDTCHAITDEGAQFSSIEPSCADGPCTGYTMPPAPQYAADGEFSVSFWLQKTECRGIPLFSTCINCREFIFSHNSDRATDMMSSSNSNVNIFLECAREQVEQARMTFMVRDSAGTLALFDYPIFSGAEPGDWINVAMSVTPRVSHVAGGVTTSTAQIIVYINGEAARPSDFSYDSMAALNVPDDGNAAGGIRAPNNGYTPSVMGSEFGQFGLGENIVIGAQPGMQLDSAGMQQELLGNLADVRVYSNALDSAGVACVLSSAPSFLSVSSAAPASCRAPEIQVTVVINTQIWANEITWQMDDGPMFGPYVDNSVLTETMCLQPGTHTLKYFDSYGDG